MAGYDAGYAAAVVEVEHQYQAAKDAAIKKRDEHWKAIVEQAEGQIVIEERIVEVIREVEVEIPRVVERIVEVAPECADLGDEFAGLLTQQALAVPGAGGTDTGVPAEPD